MKKIIILLFIYSSSLLIAHNDSSENNYLTEYEACNELISTNINYVKTSVCKKIQEAESKLEKYKVKLNNSQNGGEVKTWLKKVHEVEKKIKNLNEVLLGIDIAESKFSK